MIYLGADHRGFSLKEGLKARLLEIGEHVTDCGAFELDINDDYPDFAKAVCDALIADPEGKGILICGSGHGMDMIANKYKGIRSALCFNTSVAKQSREHEDANVLVLPSDWIKEKDAFDIVTLWLKTPYGQEERNLRRLQKMSEIEEVNFR